MGLFRVGNGGGKLNFLLDTGSQFSLIDSNYVCQDDVVSDQVTKTVTSFNNVCRIKGKTCKLNLRFPNHDVHEIKLFACHGMSLIMQAENLANDVAKLKELYSISSYFVSRHCQ